MHCSENLQTKIFYAQAGSVRLAYFDSGNGPALVLIHGMFGDHLDWEPVLEPLARHRRVIAVDLPGFGASDKPAQEYTGTFFVAALHELLGQLRITRASLMGNSFGGQIAMLFALAHPEVVHRLVLVDSGGFRKYSPQERAWTEQRYSLAALSALTPAINQVLFAPLFVRPSANQQRYLERQNAKLQRADYPAYARALVSSIRLALSTCLLDRLKDLTCPALLLWGEKDQILPLAQAQAALARLPRGELKVLPGCGHAPQLECPEEFVRAVEEFLSAQEG